MPFDESIPELQDAIKKMHGCSTVFVDTVHVHEKRPNTGETFWQGDVQVFDVIDHPKAKRAYAWSFLNEDSGKRRYIAVLGDGPVVSAVTAVQAYIVAGYKSGEIK
jgi:hypothetical protein